MSASWWTLGALVAAVLAFVVREALIGGTGWLARRAMARAARRLPEDKRELRHEEWLAEYDVFVAKNLHIRGLIHACGTYVGAVRMAPSQQRTAVLPRVLSALRRHGLHVSDVIALVLMIGASTVSIFTETYASHGVTLLARVTLILIVCAGLTLLVAPFVKVILHRKRW